MIPDKYQLLLKKFTENEAQRGALSELVNEIVEDQTRHLQKEHATALHYLNQTSSLLVALDKQGRITFVNEQLATITGYSVEELMGKSWFDIFISDEEQKAVEDTFKRVIAGDAKPLSYYENHIVIKSGKKRLVAWHNVYLTDAITGEIIGSYSSGNDITIRRGIENSLHQSELRYRQMFYNNSAIKLVLNPVTGAIIDANQAACEFYGYDYATLISMNVVDINPLPFEQLMTPDQREISERRIYQFQHRLASGEIRDVEVYTGPITLDSEDLQYSIVLDVTGREKAKEELQLRESQFRTAIDHFPNGMMLMFDTNLNCIIARGQALFEGVNSPEELEGHHLPDVLPPNIWLRVKDMYETALRGDPSQHYFEDTKRNVMIQVEPLLDEDNNIIGALHLFQDISHLRKFEQLLQDTKLQLDTILDGIVDGVAIISPNEHLLYANEAAARITGFDSVQEMMIAMQDNLRINHDTLDENGNYLEAKNQALFQALHGKTPAPQIVVFKNRDTKEEIWTETKANPIFEEGGQVRFAVIILNDRTRARQIEKFKLEVVQEQAQIETLRDYIASTTHDLSQPLSVINTAVYMLDKTVEDEAVQKRTTTIRKQSIKMQSMLQDIRQMSTLDSTRQLEFTVLDVNQIMQQIADYWTSRFEESQQSFIFEPFSGHKQIMGNGHALEQVFSQLLQNAVDYSHDDGNIYFRGLEASRKVIIEIEDNGIGISPEYHEHIFKRFYRTNKSRTTSAKSGTGLGLSIAKRIVDLHGAEIELESEPSKGSLFRITFPLHLSD